MSSPRRRARAPSRSVALWVCLLVGHAIVFCGAIPAGVRMDLRGAALGAGAASLLLGWMASAIKRACRRGSGRARAEVCCGILALVAVGGALGGEADRIQKPLPVHRAPCRSR